MTDSAADPMYQWAVDLFPICRSLTGPGVRETLNYFKGLLPELTIHQVTSGEQAFDWTIPDEWEIRSATIHDESGRKIVDFQDNNLHVVGYSEPVDTVLSLEELNKHLYSLPDQPDLIPYVTSYYTRRWGFCVPHSLRAGLKEGKYRVKIDARLFPGVLNYADVLIEGDTDQEVLFSSYVCHPSMANNELSGPVVTVALARWLKSLPKRRYSYRVILIPETIGSIVYLSRHHEAMKRKTVAGYVVTCVGDERAWSFIPSRKGGTLADRVAEFVLDERAPDFKRYSFLDRGSDERQFCSPLINLPVASITRSKYGTYPEYHTSADNLNLITQQGLSQTLDVYKRCVEVLEANRVYQNAYACEPQLGKRGLYPTVSEKGSGRSVRGMMNLIAYADGEDDLLTVSRTIGLDFDTCSRIAKDLADAGVLKITG